MTWRDRLRRAEPWLWSGAFAALLVPLVLGAARRALPAINSDALVPWRLTADVFGHRADVAWAVGGPTFVFPDLPMFALARWIAPDLGTAYAVHAALQLAFLALGAFLLVRACAAKRDGLDVAVGIAVAASYSSVVLCRHAGELVEDVFFPAEHEGAVACGLLYFALVARALRGDAGRATLTLMAAVACLAVVSDALAFPQFLLPGVVAAVVFARRGAAADGVVAWTAAGAAGGIAAYVGLGATPFCEIAMGASSPAPDKLAESVTSFVRDVPSLFERSDAVAAVAVAVFLAARLGRRGAWAASAPTVLRMLAFAWLVSFSVPALSGRWEHRATLRYMLPVWSMPLVAAAVAAVGASAGRGPRRALLGVCLLACGWTAAARGCVEPPVTPYPDVVREIDAAASAHGVTEGIGGYWYAGLATALTRRGLRLSPVERSGAPMLWLTNADWFFADAPAAPRWPEHRLIVAADVDRVLVRVRFGRPTVVVPLAGLLDHEGAPIEVWMRPPPGPPFTSDRMRDELLGATIAAGLRSIDPRRSTPGR